jgi:hypothetical protein
MGYIGAKIDSSLHRSFSVIVSMKGLTKAEILREAVKEFVEKNRGRLND